MKIKLSTNGYQIINSGLAFLYDNESELTMNIDTEKNFSFTLVLKFKTTENKEQSIEKNINENTITLICNNFENPLGTGTVKPISLATLDNKDLLLHFWSYTQDAMRKVEYSFLLKE